MRTSSLSSFSMSSGILVSWFVPRFSSTMLTHRPVSVTINHRRSTTMSDTNRLYSAIHDGSRWKIQNRRQIKNTDNTETKHNPEKQITQKHGKTKPAWLSCLLWHSARKQGRLILTDLRLHHDPYCWADVQTHLWLVECCLVEHILTIDYSYCFNTRYHRYLPLATPPPFELRKISHMAKTYNLREVAPVENH